MTAAIPRRYSSDDLSRAFEECLWILYTAQRAAHAVTAMPVGLSQPERSGLDCLVAIDKVKGRKLIPLTSWRLFYLKGDQLPVATAVSSDEHELLRAAEIKDAERLPMSLLLDVRREALASAYLVGDTRAAVVMSATACELMIDVCLGALLWEDGATPEQGAAELGRYRDVTRRLRSGLAPRLGGSWDARREDRLKGWEELVLRRNQVVHTGATPSPDAARAACDAMFEFFSLVLDRLCADRARGRYSMSALIIAGRAGLESRGGWTRAIERAADEADDHDLQGAFRRWWDALGRERFAPELSSRTGRVNFIRTEAAHEYWVERDSEQHRARLVQPTASVEDLVRRTPDRTGICASFDIEVPCRPIGRWVAEYRLVPGMAVMRDHRTWQEPPDAPHSEEMPL